jgi:hypothetical protein
VLFASHFGVNGYPFFSVGDLKINFNKMHVPISLFAFCVNSSQVQLHDFLL